MPISVGAAIDRVSQKAFSDIAFEVMGVCFRVHSELGRCFDEKIYQRELAFRLPDARVEVPVEVAFDGFHKTYFLDLLVGNAAIFELKAAESLTSRHRGQLLNYLLLTGVHHGKIVNFRSDRVQHEFVNCTQPHAERVGFSVDDRRWQEMETHGLKDRMIALFHDWGTMLDLALYEEVASYLCGRQDAPFGEVDIRVDSRALGKQQVRLVAPNVSFRISSFNSKDAPAFASHLRRFCAHTSLQAIQWINMTPKHLEFITIQP